MNDEAARQGRPDTSTITAAEDSSGSGRCCNDAVWPRCPDCGARAPTDELLERHRVRRCHGNPDKPGLVRLRPGRRER